MRTVDVLELARDAGTVEGEFEAPRLARLSGLLAPPMGRIHYRFEGRIDERGRSAANLRIEARLGLNCDLCGERLDWMLEESDRFFFVEDEAQLGALPITAEGDEPLLASRRFDLQDLVEEQTILALSKRKHVQVEIPMSLNLADAERIVDAARRSGTICMVTHTRRFSAPRGRYVISPA